MPRRKRDQNTLYMGDWNSICDVCGFKFKASDMQERWDGLMVCQNDYEVRDISDFFKVDGEDPSVPYVRPDDQEDESLAPDSYADTLTPIPAGHNNGEL